MWWPPSKITSRCLFALSRAAVWDPAGPRGGARPRGHPHHHRHPARGTRRLGRAGSERGAAGFMRSRSGYGDPESYGWRTPPREPSLDDMPRIVIAGGEIARLEALIALRGHLGSDAEVELLEANTDLVERQRAVAEPFGGDPVRRFDLVQIAADHGARSRSGHAAAHASSFPACAAEARTRISPSGSSAALITTAVCEPLCGSTPIITAAISTLQVVRPGMENVAGMPNSGSASARTSFEPRHGETRQAGTSF